MQHLLQRFGQPYGNNHLYGYWRHIIRLSEYRDSDNNS
jgi:hypothetical protein